jgi:hypothetical protein
MLRHVVLLRFNDGVGDGPVAEVTAALRALPAAIPGLRSYEVGPALGWSGGDNGWDFGIVAGFDDRDGWQEYMDHPDHDAARALLSPLVAERAIVQFEG